MTASAGIEESMTAELDVEIEGEPESATLTADAVLFSADEAGRPHVLAIRRRWEPFAGLRALPGGIVDLGEDVLAACHRELAEETGLTVATLTFTGVYSAPGRDPRGRVVSFAHAGFVPGLPTPTPASDAVEAAWLRVDRVVNGIAPLAFDHRLIVRDAVALGLRNRWLHTAPPR
jgi:8-oxo-dGTP diphosphatase